MRSQGKVKPPSPRRFFFSVAISLLASGYSGHCLADMPHAAPNSEPPSAGNGWRGAMPTEIVGAWEMHDPRKRYSNQYLVLLAGCRIGWVFTKKKLSGATKSRLVSLIDSGKVAGGDVSGWEDCQLSNGKIAVSATAKHADEAFVVWVVTELTPESKRYGGDKAAPGDLFIGQVYRYPQNATPEPLQLERFHRLPD
jgi:hypothetical protein